jgi:hypothetical protein
MPIRTPNKPKVPRKAIRKVIKDLHGNVIGEMTEHDWQSWAVDRTRVRRGKKLYAR